MHAHEASRGEITSEPGKFIEFCECGCIRYVDRDDLPLTDWEEDEMAEIERELAEEPDGSEDY